MFSWCWWRVLFTLPTVAKSSLQRFQKLNLWAQWSCTIWLTLTKWINIGGIHTCGWERIWVCFVYAAFHLFDSLTKGQNLDIIINSWRPERRDCLYKAHQKKEPQCLFHIATHNQNLNNNINTSVHVWHISIQSGCTAKWLNLLWRYFYWEPIKKLL